MKKWIPYITGIVWVIAVAAMALLDGLSWSEERKGSALGDGLVVGQTAYLMENMEGDGILYVADMEGRILHVTLSSSVWEKSIFGRLCYREGNLYGVLKARAEEGGEAWEYKVVRFDAQGRADAQTPRFSMEEGGILTGFAATEEGCYLTFVLKGGEEAGVYFVDSGELAASEEDSDEEPQELELFLLEACEEGRLIVEARYKEGELLLRMDDGGSAEGFELDAKALKAFQKRRLPLLQMMKLRREQMVFYIQVFLIGDAVLLLLYMVLQNRSHLIYTIVVSETVLALITAASSLLLPRAGKRAREEEARRFGLYYVESLADGAGSLESLPLEEEDFYGREEYYSLRNRLSGFVGLDGVSQVFVDLCLVRGEDHRIVASASGRNGQPLEELYGASTAEMLSKLEGGSRTASTVGFKEGQRFEFLGVAESGKLAPDYFYVGVARSSVSEGDSIPYLICVQIAFLAGSLVSVVLLLLQDKELGRLAEGMRRVAEEQAEVPRGQVHGKDVELMWNSLTEIQKKISRINYTKDRIFESCCRFAPRNINRILGKDSITEIKGGDMVPLEGTLAVVSSIEPEGTGQEAVDRMNRFITLIEERQEECGGFFVSARSDLEELKILFLEASKSTVEFGVSVVKSLHEEGSLDALRASMLLHYSKYVYGVAGTGRQSFPFLLSGEIEEIEEYARWFQRMNVKLVITQSVKDHEGISGGVRYIGYILLPSQGKRVRLFEVLDAYPLHERRLKSDTDVKFQAALEHFYQHDFYLARSSFSDVLKENPMDYMAKWYLFTCEKFLNETHFEGDICRLDRKERFMERL